MNNRRARSILVAPTPMINESPASWIQRTCQMHAVSYRELMDGLGIRPCADPDVGMPAEHLSHIAIGTDVAPTSLSALASVFHSIRALPRLKSLLLFDCRGCASYRFCRRCLATDEIPYLRIEWRFRDWTLCPMHREPLSERCLMCRAGVKSTRPAIGSDGIDTLLGVSDCAVCHTRLTFGLSDRTDAHTADDSSAIGVQRAVVSAVINGFFCINGYKNRLPLDFYLWLRENYGWIGDRIWVGNGGQDPQCVSAVVHKLLSIYRNASSAIPFIGLTR